MAWTVTKYQTVFGDKRAVGMKLVANTSTQTVETGLSVIEWYSIGRGSMTSAAPAIFINSNASGVASMGVLGCSGFTSGDEIYITVYGR